MTTNRELTTGEAIRYLGISKSCLLHHAKKGNISPAGIKPGINSHRSKTYYIKDLDNLKELIAYDKQKPVTLTQDEQTEFDSVIHWSRKYRKLVPSKDSPGRTLEYVPVTCRCGIECEVHTYEFRRKDQPRLPLCRTCASYVTRRRGNVHDRWVAGEFMRQDGYKAIHIARLSPKEQELFKSMVYKGYYITEHRIVMARHLGRPLKRNEHVHHINKAKADNRLSNLKLVSPQEHAQEELTWARKEVKRLRAILDKHGIPY